MKGKILGIFTVLLVLCVYLALATADPWYDLSSSKFLNPGNIQNLLNRLSLFGILGIGVAFVIITSGIDLSVGSIVCLAGVLLSLFLKVDYQPASQIDVSRIVAAEQLIVTRGVLTDLQPGSTVRYTGGIGSGLVLTVDAVNVASDAMEIRVKEPLQRDETDGKLVLAVPVTKLDNGQQPVVTLASLTSLNTADKLLMVKADGSMTTQSVAAVQAAGQTQVATLAKPPADKYGKDAFAIILRRHQRTSIPVAITLVLLIAAGLGLVLVCW